MTDEDNHLYSKAQIRFMLVRAFEEEAHWVAGIANSETEIEKEQLAPIIDKVSAQMGRRVELRRSAPRRGWKISTLVGFIHAEQESFEIIPPQNP